MATLVQPLAFVADPHDLEFFSSTSRIYDLLVIAWILDDGEEKTQEDLQRYLLQ